VSLNILACSAMTNSAAFTWSDCKVSLLSSSSVLNERLASNSEALVTQITKLDEMATKIKKLFARKRKAAELDDPATDSEDATAGPSSSTPTPVVTPEVSKQVCTSTILSYPS
jgi:hypothetical protein